MIYNMITYPISYIYNIFSYHNHGGIQNSFGIDVIFNSIASVISFFLFLLTTFLDAIIIVLLYCIISYTVRTVEKMILPVKTININQYIIKTLTSTSEKVTTKHTDKKQNVEYQIEYFFKNKKYQSNISKKDYDLLNLKNSFILHYQDGTKIFIKNITIL